MTWYLRFKRKKKEVAAEHNEINRRLDAQEEALGLMAKRVRILEAEAGIRVPSRLKEVNGR